jgi:hypothetical protein
MERNKTTTCKGLLLFSQILNVDEATKSDSSRVEKAKSIIQGSNHEINDYAASYVDGLDKITNEDNQVENQIRRIIVNIDVTDEESANLVSKLEDVSDIQPGTHQRLTEARFERISTGFESFTEQKVNQGSQITIEDFKEYAEGTPYQLTEVLASNPWKKTILTTYAREKVSSAEEKVELDF